MPGWHDAQVTALSDRDYEALARFRRSILMFTRAADALARGAGVSPTQNLLLLTIRAHTTGQDPTISSLADELQLRPHSVTELVQRAQRAGLVDVIANPADARSRCVRLTERGIDVLAEQFERGRSELYEARQRLLDDLRAVQEPSTEQ